MLQERLCDLNSNPKNIFDLDPRLRVSIRILIETSAIVAVYILWLVNITNPRDLDISFHTVNLVIWILLYKKIGLANDRIRYSTLNSYVSIIYLSALFSSSLTINYFIYCIYCFLQR